jgi:hypothetical protein
VGAKGKGNVVPVLIFLHFSNKCEFSSVGVTLTYIIIVLSLESTVGAKNGSNIW